jgi:V8-like Glu-specific endopeptidase
MLLEDKDRRQQVKKLDLLHFPNNCIGRINLKHRSSKQSVFATGFLISSSLVLTSAHTFTGLSEKYDPNALSTFQLEIYDNVNGTAIKNEYKVQNYRILYEYKKDER